MPRCDSVRLPGGGTAIVCGGRRGRALRCTYCSATSTKLCDYPILKIERGHEVRGMCDAPLCARCAKPIDEKRDLCRAHVPLWDFETNVPKVGPGAAAAAGER